MLLDGLANEFEFYINVWAASIRRAPGPRGQNFCDIQVIDKNNMVIVALAVHSIADRVTKFSPSTMNLAIFGRWMADSFLWLMGKGSFILILGHTCVFLSISIYFFVPSASPEI
jgi:hypothetical protein